MPAAGAGWRAATYSIFVDRAIGLIALAIIIVASLPWSYNLITDPHGRSALLLVDFAALAGGSRISGARHAAMAVAEALVGNASCLCLLGDREPRVFSRDRGPKVAVLSVLVHVLAVVIAWCVVQSIARAGACSARFSSSCRR